jgi:hypothetical protein
MAVVVVPWVVHNKIEYDRIAISTISEEVLFWRAFDGAPGQRLEFVGDDSLTRKVRKWYSDAEAGSPSGPVGVWSVKDRLGPEVDVGGMALRAIVADPGKYLRTSITYFDDFAKVGRPRGPSEAPYLVQSYQRALSSAPSLIHRPVASVSWRALNGAKLLTALWWIISFGGFAGLLLLLAPSHRQQVAMTSFATTFVVIGVGTALTSLPNPRYWAAGLMPLLVVGSAGFVTVCCALLEYMRQMGVRRRVSQRT